MTEQVPSTSSTTLPAAAVAANHAAVKAAIAKSQTAVSDLSTSPTSKEAVPATTLDAGLLDPRPNLTVFSSATEFTVKHPLYSNWQLWFDSASRQDKAKHWDDALIKVVEVDSVEEFWGLYNNIVPPSMIHPQSNYYLFKRGIKPAWEDAANTKGGKWSIQLPRGKFGDTIDNYWLYTMLAAIGETFETPYVPASDSSSSPSSPAAPLPSTFADEVTGVIVSSRKAFYRISLWTRSSAPEDRAKLENIGRQFKYSVLGLNAAVSISQSDKVSSEVEFMSHADSQTKPGQGKVTKYTV